MKLRQLGEILLEMGAVDQHQLQAALAHQRQWGMPLGQAVIDKRFCSRETVLRALARQATLPVINLDAEQLDSTVAPLLPKKVAEQYRAVPLRVEGARHEVLAVAIAAPANLEALDAIKAVTGKRRINAFLADDASLERAFGRIYLGYDRVDTQGPQAESRAISLDEVEFDFGPEPKQRPLLVFGWTEEAGRNLTRILAADGVSAKVATAQEVLACGPDEVVVAPLPAIEALVPVGDRAPGLLVVAGKVPEEDLPRAQRLGARGFIVAPLDTGLLLRSVRRCLALGAAARAHAA